MRSILLHAHDDDAFDARLQVALDLARAFDGHLTCLQAVEFDFVLPGDYNGMLSTEMIQVAKEHAARFRQRTEEKLQSEDVSWTWDDRLGQGDSALLQFAALSDVVVVGARSPEGGRGPSWLAGALAIHARVPVLAVPAHSPGLQYGAPVLVGWNGSTESSRALKAAVPLLKTSESVTLATVGRGEGQNGDVDLPPVQGAEYLARHGIECEMLELPADGRQTVAEKLCEAARARGAGLVVMGAYGHSRWLETLLGGTTRVMLSDPPVPLFLAN